MSGTDIFARLVGAKLSESWKQAVIVDNRPGGGTIIGTGHLAMEMLKLMAGIDVIHAVVPDVPTIAETALPGFEAIAWFGVFLPAGAPQAVVHK